MEFSRRSIIKYLAGLGFLGLIGYHKENIQYQHTLAGENTTPQPTIKHVLCKQTLYCHDQQVLKNFEFRDCVLVGDEPRFIDCLLINCTINFSLYFYSRHTGTYFQNCLIDTSVNRPPNALKGKINVYFAKITSKNYRV